DVLQGNAGIGGKSDGCLLRIGPALAEIVARSQHGAPVTRRRSPDSVLAPAGVVGHRVDTVPMEIGTADLPSVALSIRAQNECSFGRSQQQKEVSLSDLSMADAVQDSRPRRIWIGARTGRNDSSRLNGFQRCLNFTLALITLYRFLNQ